MCIRDRASAYALEALQQQVDIPVIGVVRPGARVAARESVGGNIGVISTAATAESHIYRQYIQSLRPEAKVFEKACPLFVPLVEEGWRKDPVTRTVAERYLQMCIRDRVGPDVCAVGRYEDGNIAYDGDSLIVGIALQGMPLGIKHKLQEGLVVDLILQLFLPEDPVLPVQIPQGFRPFSPGKAVLFVL